MKSAAISEQIKFIDIPNTDGHSGKNNNQCNNSNKSEKNKITLTLKNTSNWYTFLTLRLFTAVLRCMNKNIHLSVLASTILYETAVNYLAAA